MRQVSYEAAGGLT